MIKETGQVIKVEDNKIFVETAIKSTCKTCAAKPNCGTSSIAEAFAGKSVINEVENDLGAQLSDLVEIGIPEETLVKGAFTIYMLPLLTMMISIGVTQFWLSRFIDIGEPQVILAAFIGGFAGFWFAQKKLSLAEPEALQPKLLRIIPNQTASPKSSIDITEVSD